MRGVAHQLSPRSGFRLVCYCKDCQAFAHLLKRPDVLDEAGGTDIFQMAPGRVTLTSGADALRCLRFSNRVFRWYSDCCRTPIANTASTARFPIAGLIHSFMGNETAGPFRNELLGPPLCRIHGGSAIAPLPPSGPPPVTLRLFFYRGAKVLGWWRRGLAQPTPFFDPRTKAPVSAPHLITASKPAAL